MVKHGTEASRRFRVGRERDLNVLLRNWRRLSVGMEGRNCWQPGASFCPPFLQFLRPDLVHAVYVSATYFVNIDVPFCRCFAPATVTGLILSLLPAAFSDSGIRLLPLVSAFDLCLLVAPRRHSTNNYSSFGQPSLTAESGRLFRERCQFVIIACFSFFSHSVYHLLPSRSRTIVPRKYHKFVNPLHALRPIFLDATFSNASSPFISRQPSILAFVPTLLSTDRLAKPCKLPRSCSRRIALSL